MSACKGESRLVVIEARGFPTGGCMTLRAIMIEVASLMIRVCDRSILVLMTAITDARSARVAGFVTRCAVGTSMCPGQRETCQVVIDCCR
jgi:hypothetical protein